MGGDGDGGCADRAAWMGLMGLTGLMGLIGLRGLAEVAEVAEENVGGKLIMALMLVDVDGVGGRLDLNED